MSVNVLHLGGVGADFIWGRLANLRDPSQRLLFLSTGNQREDYRRWEFLTHNGYFIVNRALDWAVNMWNFDAENTRRTCKLGKDFVMIFGCFKKWGNCSIYIFVFAPNYRIASAFTNHWGTRTTTGKGFRLINNVTLTGEGGNFIEDIVEVQHRPQHRYFHLDLPSEK